MHHFYSHKYSFCHQSLQKGLLHNIHHLHLSAISIYLVLESIKEEAFLITFSIVGLLLCEQSSILEEISSTIEPNNSCIWRLLEWSLTCNLQFQGTVVSAWPLVSLSGNSLKEVAMWGCKVYFPYEIFTPKKSIEDCPMTIFFSESIIP